MSESNPKAAVSWVAVVLGAVVAAFVVGVVAMVVDAGKARAAPVPTRATIEVTQFAVPSAQVGEGFAVCPGTKRAVGGGVVQSGPAGFGTSVAASGPLDASGVTAQTVTGDVAKQWYAAVANYTSFSDHTYRVFAICSGRSAARIKATPLFDVGDRTTIVERFAVCPENKRALGGGVIQSGPASLYFFQTASGPLDASGEPLRTGDGDIAKQWYAAPGHDSSQERRFRVFSICE